MVRERLSASTSSEELSELEVPPYNPQYEPEVFDTESEEEILDTVEYDIQDKLSNDDYILLDANILNPIKDITGKLLITAYRKQIKGYFESISFRRLVDAEKSKYFAGLCKIESQEPDAFGKTKHYFLTASKNMGFTMKGKVYRQTDIQCSSILLVKPTELMLENGTLIYMEDTTIDLLNIEGKRISLSIEGPNNGISAIRRAMQKIQYDLPINFYIYTNANNPINRAVATGGNRSVEYGSHLAVSTKILNLTEQ